MQMSAFMQISAAGIQTEFHFVSLYDRSDGRAAATRRDVDET